MTRRALPLLLAVFLAAVAAYYFWRVPLLEVPPAYTESPASLSPAAPKAAAPFSLPTEELPTAPEEVAAQGEASPDAADSGAFAAAPTSVFFGLADNLAPLIDALPPDAAARVRDEARRLQEVEAQAVARQEQVATEFEARWERAVGDMSAKLGAPEPSPDDRLPAPSAPAVVPEAEISDPPAPEAAPAAEVRSDDVPASSTPMAKTTLPAVLDEAQQRALLHEGARRFGRAIREAARRHRLEPAFLLCVMNVESALAQEAVSPKGAVGLMQLMPRTAAELGANPYDLTSNVLAGAALIDRLLRENGDDVTLAMASYNAGPAAVARHRGVPPYEETRRYVDRIRRECGPARP